MSDSDSDIASSAGSIIEDASEADTTTFKCLFCATELGSVIAVFTHCETEHKFNVRKSIQEIGSVLKEIGVIKLINFLRLEGQKGTEPSTITVTLETLADDKYLQPTLADDPLLFELGDFMPEDDSKAVDYDEYEEALSKNVPEGVEKIALNNDRDELYFESYKGASIHREMIEDRTRTEGYRDFIVKQSSIFAGKTVLDVGCGTGILSLFCARAGAKKVFAVDNSAIALRAREIVAKNGYADTVEVIQGRVEDYHAQSLIGKEKVDIIVSEWMGYGLLFEGMLDSVLHARDMYLKPDGLMVPSHCTLRIAPISDKTWIEDSTWEGFWKDVYGFDFSPMIPGGPLNEKEIGVFDVPEKAICGSSSLFNTIDIAKVKVQELDFKAPFEFKMNKDIDSLDGFAIWFDTFFLANGSKADISTEYPTAAQSTEGAGGIAFSTGPYTTPTHWHQAVTLLQDSDRRKKMAAGSILKGEVEYKKERRDHRGVEVNVTWDGEGSEGKVSGSLSRTMA